MASEKIEALVSEVEKLTVLELSELVSAIEEKFGVSAAAAVAAAEALVLAVVNIVIVHTDRSFCRGWSVLLTVDRITQNYEESMKK